MKIEIIPAILPRDFAEVEEKIGLVKGLVKTVQIDVCDGQFTPQATWPYRKHDDFFEKLVHEAEGLPGWEELNFEIDLMVNKVEEVVDEWVIAGASRLVLHIESRSDIAKAIEIVNSRAEVGLAINIDTPLEKLDQYRGRFQFIQCMGIDQIGFQGQAFDEKVLTKIKEIHPDIPVSVDGGVSLETASQLIAAGADRLVAGSAIFEADNVIEAIRNFKAL